MEILKNEVPVSLELQNEIEQFLYLEAEHLDWRRFEDWYEMLDDSIHYFMPIRTNRMSRDLENEFSRPDEAAHFDDDKESMRIRIKRLRTNMAWAEDPPSRTRHLISNVRIGSTNIENELQVRSSFIVYRNRMERDVDIFAGERHDLIRKSSKCNGWSIRKRTIYLDQSTILAKNISIFF